jgi:hypothetical protein
MSTFLLQTIEIDMYIFLLQSIDMDMYIFVLQTIEMDIYFPIANNRNGHIFSYCKQSKWTCIFLLQTI